MERCTLFYYKKDRELKKIEKLLEQKKINCNFQDVKENGLVSYLFQDMQITTLPALHFYTNNRIRAPNHLAHNYKYQEFVDIHHSFLYLYHHRINHCTSFLLLVSFVVIDNNIRFLIFNYNFLNS